MVLFEKVPLMQATAWGAFTASAVALFVSWLNGRREHRERQRAEEADAAQVLIDEVTHDGVWIRNHSSMYVTGVQVRKAKMIARTPDFTPVMEWVAQWTEVTPLLAPKKRTYCQLKWEPAPGLPHDSPAPPERFVTSPWDIQFTFFDSRGVGWKRTGHDRPKVRKMVVHEPDGSCWWKPTTWKLIAKWREPVELIHVKRDL
ncbi:hypothetical protein [Streptomyces violaceus]|uniref:Secreted protein n=1 Tax=Streptomyces violaceus TaxID=1936 RepID=A0ABY9UFT8_STRVL|nr:hypothetical protein [Streptomyces janthinus]WND21147.1 hypothetical protein RI060_29110 [Streptomyces janthinus]GGS47873.1 hypothetical protein GCM10010270_17400 [Streptomyces janthinus]